MKNYEVKFDGITQIINSNYPINEVARQAIRDYFYPAGFQATLVGPGDHEFLVHVNESEHFPGRSFNLTIREIPSGLTPGQIREIDRKIPPHRWYRRPIIWTHLEDNSPAYDFPREEVPFIDQLPRKTFSDLYEGTPMSAMADFVHPVEDWIFILELPSGEEWLVDQGGAGYIRFALRLIDDEGEEPLSFYECARCGHKFVEQAGITQCPECQASKIMITFDDPDFDEDEGEVHSTGPEEETQELTFLNKWV